MTSAWSLVIIEGHRQPPSKLNLLTNVNNSFSYSQLQIQLRKLSHFKLSSVQSTTRFVSVQKLSMKVSSKNKSSQNTTFVEKFYGFSETPFRVPWIHKDTSCANDFTCIQMFNSRITSDALMHSNVSIQIDSQNAFMHFLSSWLIKRNFYVLKTCPNSSPSFKSMYKYPWAPQNSSQKDTISQHPRYCPYTIQTLRWHCNYWPGQLVQSHLSILPMTESRIPNCFTNECLQ